jgi:DNA-binding MarR family transcriptional regulator
MRTGHVDSTSKPRDDGSDGRAPLSLGLLPALLGYHLRRAQSAVFDDFSATVAPREDITPGLFGMLQVIAANPGLSQSRLANAMGVDRSTIVTVIDALEARGLVARERSPRDMRTHALRVTAKGRPALRRMEELVLRHEEAVARGLTPDERRTLMSLLVRLYDGPRPPTRGAAHANPRRHDR